MTLVCLVQGPAIDATKNGSSKDMAITAPQIGIDRTLPQRFFGSELQVSRPLLAALPADM